jgi:hypothetical protein
MLTKPGGLLQFILSIYRRQSNIDSTYFVHQQSTFPTVHRYVNKQYARSMGPWKILVMEMSLQPQKGNVMCYFICWNFQNNLPEWHTIWNSFKTTLFQLFKAEEYICKKHSSNKVGEGHMAQGVNFLSKHFHDRVTSNGYCRQFGIRWSWPLYLSDFNLCDFLWGFWADKE